MTLRPEYSLGHSQYNAFLFAPVGAQTEGEVLTVLSALTRLNIDPWREAARLSDLPRDVAATALAASLARLPDAGLKIPDAEANAIRLVAMLPTASAPEIPTTPESRGAPRAPRSPDAAPASRPAPSRLGTWLFWVGLVVAGFLLFQLLQRDNNFESPDRTTFEQR